MTTLRDVLAAPSGLLAELVGPVVGEVRGAPDLAYAECAACACFPCVCRLARRVEPCACGGSIEAPAAAADLAAAVLAHNRSTRHRRWWSQEELRMPRTIDGRRSERVEVTDLPTGSPTGPVESRRVDWRPPEEPKPYLVVQPPRPQPAPVPTIGVPARRASRKFRTVMAPVAPAPRRPRAAAAPLVLPPPPEVVVAPPPTEVGCSHPRAARQLVAGPDASLAVRCWACAITRGVA